MIRTRFPKVNVDILVVRNNKVLLGLLTSKGDWEKWEWFDKNNTPKNLFPATKNLIESYLKNKVNVSE